MNVSFQFDDSEIRLAFQDEHALTLRFSAAHVRWPGPLSFQQHSGYARNLELSLAGAHWTGPLQECVGRLASGWLHVDSDRYSTLPLPFERTGAVACEIVFQNGTLLAVKAQAIACRFTGEPCIAESYAC